MKPLLENEAIARLEYHTEKVALKTPISQAISI